MSAEELQSWAEGAVGLQMVAEYTVPWVTGKIGGSAAGSALDGVTSEACDAAGWCSYSGLLATKPDEQLIWRRLSGVLECGGKGIAQRRIGSATR